MGLWYRLTHDSNGKWPEFDNCAVVMYEIVLIFRKYTLKYLTVG